MTRGLRCYFLDYISDGSCVIFIFLSCHLQQGSSVRALRFCAVVRLWQPLWSPILRPSRISHPIATKLEPLYFHFLIFRGYIATLWILSSRR